MKYKIRFHLLNGKNYRHWQVVKYGSIHYFDPSNTQLIMYNCTLYNNPNISKKIFGGKNKTVCAWVNCDDFELNPYSFEVSIDNLKKIDYNPRVSPYWMMDQNNIDGMNFSCLITKYNKIYLKNE